MGRQVQFEGVTHDFPDDATDAEIGAALQSRAKPAEPKPSGTQRFSRAASEANPLAMRQAPETGAGYGVNLQGFSRAAKDLGSTAVKGLRETFVPGPGNYGTGSALNLVHAIPMIGPPLAEAANRGWPELLGTGIGMGAQGVPTGPSVRPHLMEKPPRGMQIPPEPPTGFHPAVPISQGADVRWDIARGGTNPGVSATAPVAPPPSSGLSAIPGWIANKIVDRYVGKYGGAEAAGFVKDLIKKKTNPQAAPPPQGPAGTWPGAYEPPMEPPPSGESFSGTSGAATRGQQGPTSATWARKEGKPAPAESTKVAPKNPFSASPEDIAREIEKGNAAEAARKAAAAASESKESGPTTLLADRPNVDAWKSYRQKVNDKYAKFAEGTPEYDAAWTDARKAVHQIWEDIGNKGGHDAIKAEANKLLGVDSMGKTKMSLKQYVDLFNKLHDEYKAQ